jgi:uncharacterized protein involved in response to NO
METLHVTRSSGRRTGHFVLHYFEMCLAMCVGLAVLDLVYVAIAAWFGYSEPLAELPVLSLLVATFNMTAPMAGWMAVRHMPQRAIVEMSAAMVVLAIALLAFGLVGLIPMSQLALLEHALMMPAMLVPMLLRVDVYAGHLGHGAKAAQPVGT